MVLTEYDFAAGEGMRGKRRVRPLHTGTRAISTQLNIGDHTFHSLPSSNQWNVCTVLQGTLDVLENDIPRMQINTGNVTRRLKHP